MYLLLVELFVNKGTHQKFILRKFGNDSFSQPVMYITMAPLHENLRSIAGLFNQTQIAFQPIRNAHSDLAFDSSALRSNANFHATGP